MIELTGAHLLVWDDSNCTETIYPSTDEKIQIQRQEHSHLKGHNPPLERFIRSENVQMSRAIHGGDFILDV